MPLALLTGCALTDTATMHSPVPGPAISGVAFGGSQPITGAKVYLLAANPAGYGSASLSLLTSASTGNAADSVGAYVSTAAGTGGFNLAPAGNADYDCTQGYALGANTGTATPTNLFGNEQVYLYIKGGNSGSGNNNNIGLLAALGPCNNIYSNTITVNELTTVAAAYAMAGYATDATHLASSGSALAIMGLSNAGLNSANLVNLATGLPVANSTGITRPVATIYTLGDILAACVNGKSGNTNCSTLFTYTQSSGTTGTGASDTATAAINLAHNPYPSAAGMTALYGLVPATGAPFAGGLTSQPNDFTVSLNYTGGGLNGPFSVAIDGSGNAWAANPGANSVSEFSSTGAAISPAAGYTGGGLNYCNWITIDGSGSAWTSNSGNSSVSKFSSAGVAISPSGGYTGGGIYQTFFIAIDGSGDAWIADTNGSAVSELSNTGAAISPSAGYTGGGVTNPLTLAIDGSGNTWTVNRNNSLSKFSSTGTALSPSAGYTGGGVTSASSIALDGSGNVWIANYNSNSLSKFSSTGTAISSTGYTGGGLNSPYGISIDGSGSVWAANYRGGSVTKFSNTGVAISPSTGYTSAGLNGPFSAAIDGSGDVWTANYTNSSLTELIGAATPVATPLAANLATPYGVPASKP
jgi:hypothetical protein